MTSITARTFLTVALTLGFAGITMGQGKGGNKGGSGLSSEIPLIVTFENRPADKILGIGGPYVDSVEDVEARVVGAGNFKLDTRGLVKQKGRYVSTGSRVVEFVFDTPVDCAVDPCIPPYSVVPTFMSTTNCGLVPRDLTLMGTKDTTCNLNFRLVVRADPLEEWFLRFSPELGGTQVKVECTSEDETEKCNLWNIVAEATDIAVLLNQNLEPVARYLMPALINVEVKP